MYQGTVRVTWSVHYFMFNDGNLVTWILPSLCITEKVRLREGSAPLRVAPSVGAAEI